MHKRDNPLIPAYEYLRLAGNKFTGPFADRVGRALAEGIKKGMSSVSVRLPDKYRQLTGQGAELRGRMESALKDANYSYSYRDAQGHYWWDHDDSDEEPSAAEKLLKEMKEKPKPATVEIEPQRD